jgi:hypothetical protein
VAAVAVLAGTLALVLWPDDQTPAPDSAVAAATGGFAKSEILFSLGENGDQRLVAFDIDTRRTRDLRQGVDARRPVISPDRKSYLYLLERYVAGKPAGGVPYLAGSAPAQQVGRPLLSRADRATCPYAGPPAWSPSGKQLALVCWDEAQSPIGLYRTDGTGHGLTLVSDDTSLADPTWVSEDEVVVVKRSGAGKPAILVALDTAGAQPQPWSSGRSGDDSKPDWSAQGGLLFLRTPPGDSSAGAIVMKHAPGDTAAELVPGHDATSPTWGPDGTSVVWVEVTQNGTGPTSYTLLVKPENGDPEVVLHQDGVKIGSPAWGSR